MNKNLVLTVGMLGLCLCWTGCHKSEKLSQPSAFKPSAGPVEMKLKWSPGEHIEQQMEMTMENETTLPGQTTSTKQEVQMGQGYRMDVLKETPDGGHEVEMEFLSARMNMTMGGNSLIDYDSDRKSSTEKPNPATDIFGKIVGAKIKYFMDASNNVVRMEGINELIARISAGQQAQALAVMKGMYNDGYFKQMMSANRFLPPKAVQIGDTWPVHLDMSVPGLGGLFMDYEIDFQGWETHGARNCARLEFQGTMKTTPDTNSNVAGVNISSLDGTSAGVAWFDPELGITIDTTMNQDMKMVMNLPASARPGGGDTGKTQSMTNLMKQAMTMKMVSVK